MPTPFDARVRPPHRAAVLLTLCLLSASSLLAQHVPVPSSLTVDDRIYGLSLIWRAAATGFAHFEPGGREDWNQTYRRFLPRVMDADTDAVYHDLLLEFCATLGDGHTTVFPPDDLRDRVDRPNLQVRNVDRQAIVAAVGRSLQDRIPVGARIVAVDGVATDAFVRRQWLPRTCASSERLRWEIGLIKLLEGPRGSTVTIGFERPGGGVEQLTLTRNSRDLDEPRVNRDPRTEQRLETRRLDGDIAYVALNTFAQQEIVGEFEQLVPELRHRRGLILDLRRNGGGESDIGEAIIAYLLDRPVPTYSWSTPMHYAAYGAWGRWTADFPPAELATLDPQRRQYLDHHRGDAWFTGESRIIQPAAGAMPAMPVVVLVGPMTGSAAEDVLVPLSA